MVLRNLHWKTYQKIMKIGALITSKPSISLQRCFIFQGFRHLGKALKSTPKYSPKWVGLPKTQSEKIHQKIAKKHQKVVPRDPPGSQNEVPEPINLVQNLTSDPSGCPGMPRDPPVSLRGTPLGLKSSKNHQFEWKMCVFYSKSYWKIDSITSILMKHVCCFI